LKIAAKIKNFMSKKNNWERYEHLVSEYEILELWRGLQRALDRRDIFWVLFYAHQLSTVLSKNAKLSDLPVIQYSHTKVENHAQR